MRNTRDYHTEMKALEERKRVLKTRRIEQLGNLVSATGAAPGDGNARTVLHRAALHAERRQLQSLRGAGRLDDHTQHCRGRRQVPYVRDKLEPYSDLHAVVRNHWRRIPDYGKSRH